MATLKERLQHDLTIAMRSRDETATSTLRMVLAALMNAEVAGKEAKALSDTEAIAVIRSEAKKRIEAAEIYEQAGRVEQAAAERSELAVIETYLPAAMDRAQLDAIVADEVAAAAAAGNTGPKAMGGVIKAVKTRVGDHADGGQIAAAVKVALSQ